MPEFKSTSYHFCLSDNDCFFIITGIFFDFLNISVIRKFCWWIIITRRRRHPRNFNWVIWSFRYFEVSKTFLSKYRFPLNLTVTIQIPFFSFNESVERNYTNLHLDQNKTEFSDVVKFNWQWTGLMLNENYFIILTTLHFWRRNGYNYVQPWKHSKSPIFFFCKQHGL